MQKETVCTVIAFTLPRHTNANIGLELSFFAPLIFSFPHCFEKVFLKNAACHLPIGRTPGSFIENFGLSGKRNTQKGLRALQSRFNSVMSVHIITHRRVPTGLVCSHMLPVFNSSIASLHDSISVINFHSGVRCYWHHIN